MWVIYLASTAFKVEGTLRLFEANCDLADGTLRQDRLKTEGALQVPDEAIEEEKIHIDIHFPSDITLTNRSGLITPLIRVSKPIAAPCDWPLGTMVITRTGNVVPCCNDYFENKVAGNVSTHSSTELSYRSEVDLPIWRR